MNAVFLLATLPIIFSIVENKTYNVDAGVLAGLFKSRLSQPGIRLIWLLQLFFVVFCLYCLSFSLEFE